jgi:hypothetical protein
VLSPIEGSADIAYMENLSIDLEHLSTEDLRDELAELEAKAAQLSAMRSHLHHQIDFGFETATTRTREREVSDERNALHRRIDSIREIIRARESA